MLLAQFIYRLSKCPELSLGLFSTAAPGDLASSSPTYAFSRSPDSILPTRKATLIAQVIATKTETLEVTDDSMDVPLDWSSNHSVHDQRGHQEQGRTIAIHSVAVIPQFQNRGLGKTVLNSYLQRMESAGIADLVSLLAHDDMIDFYQKLGFQNQGKSPVKFGGGGWNDLRYPFQRPGPGIA